jgi:WhiB family redox-sensing transcriptional regulator
MTAVALVDLATDPDAINPDFPALPGAWASLGLCGQTDPEVFFPEKGGSTADAKKVCMRCPVRAQCLAFALDNNERHGIWGGLSERERRALKPKKKTRAVVDATVSTLSRENANTATGGAQPAESTRGPRRDQGTTRKAS